MEHSWTAGSQEFHQQRPPLDLFCRRNKSGKGLYSPSGTRWIFKILILESQCLHVGNTLTWSCGWLDWQRATLNLLRVSFQASKPHTNSKGYNNQPRKLARWTATPRHPKQIINQHLKPLQDFRFQRGSEFYLTAHQASAASRGLTFSFLQTPEQQDNPRDLPALVTHCWGCPWSHLSNPWSLCANPVC